MNAMYSHWAYNVIVGPTDPFAHYAHGRPTGAPRTLPNRSSELSSASVAWSKTVAESTLRRWAPLRSWGRRNRQQWSAWTRQRSIRAPSRPNPSPRRWVLGRLGFRLIEDRARRRARTEPGSEPNRRSQPFAAPSHRVVVFLDHRAWVGFWWLEHALI